jgi:hypothetical protein
MIRAAVSLDASMSVQDALARLARHGYWLTPDSPEAASWIDQYLARIRKALAESPCPRESGVPRESGIASIDPSTLDSAAVARLLAKPLDQGRAVIRRQEGVTIFWYARKMEDLLPQLAGADRSATLKDALMLHEYQASQAQQYSSMSSYRIERFEGVVLNGLQVYGVGESTRLPDLFDIDFGASRGGTTGPAFAGSPVPPAATSPQVLRAYPNVDAPAAVAVGQRFPLTIGISDSAVAGVFSSGPMTIAAPANAKSVAINIQVIADGFDAVDGWTRTLQVDLAAPTQARVGFNLIARPQAEPVRMTAIVVHYSVNGATCGIAFRHIVVGHDLNAIPKPDDRGQSWRDLEPQAAELSLVASESPDVELDIVRPNGNAAKGDYSCVFRNAHGVPAPGNSFEIHLGDDAEGFAKDLIDDMRRWGTNPLAHNLLEAFGKTAADKLPREFWSMLSEVASRVRDRPLTLQLSSAEPYIPWELALLETPLDPTRPAFLGAQVNMGRWILGDSKIAASPRSYVSVKAMAVMAGMYNPASGLRPLPMAQQEAQDLETAYADLPVIRLDCTPPDLKALLDATLVRNTENIGGVQLVHFAGHGEVDPTRPGDAALFLSNGQPISPKFLRFSMLGKQHAPFIFLNACMVGTGGQYLGDAGGFPGNSLAGGFAGLVAPLWAVNDTVAHSVAIDFYRQLFAAGNTSTVSQLMREVRAQYKSAAPVPSYLAYVFYGNPNLKLARA